jgi:opacity protein-like surface antigen
MTRIKSAGFSVRMFALLLSATVPALYAMPLRAEEPQDRLSGFRIGKPRVFIGGHAGMNFPQAASDLFGLVTRELTLQKSDFQAPLGGFDVGIPFRSRFAAVFSFEYGRSTAVSESRDFVEENGDPIRQTTRFSQMPITGTLRFYPIKMGETVGSYAWIPNRLLPYVGGGGGILRYNFSQFGDFVDSRNLNIFTADLQSNGFVVTKHVAAGMDIGVTSLIFVNVEGRYSWAKADLSPDFTGFEPIDLSGLRVIGGVFFRF